MEEKEKTIITFDATELDNFEMCTFRWHAFHDLNYRPRKTESFFEKGTLLHFMMEHYYKRKMTKVIDQIDIEEIIEMTRIKSLEFDLTLEDVSEHIYQFREYYRYYEDENIIPLHVEQPFMVKIHEDEDIELYIQGLPDLIFKYPNGSVAVLDHKGVRREFPYSPLRNQFYMYATAIGTDTVIINKIGFQKSKKPSERFLRIPLIYSDELKEEWKQKIIFRAKEMIMYEESQYFPRNNTSCEKFGGCYLQRYCTTKPRAREFLIGTEYIIGKPWDAGFKLEKESEK